MIKAKKKETIKEASLPSKKRTNNATAIGEIDSKKSSINALENESKQPAVAPSALDMWVPPKKRRRTHAKEDEETYPVQPNIIHIVTKPRTHVNHTYRDFSSVPLPDGSTKMEIPQDVSQMSFHLKVYHLLSTKVEPSNSSIEWCSHGRAFRIVQIERLEYRLPLYFGHNRLSKFRKQLIDHGFKLITEGRDSGCYYSEFLLRGLPHLSHYAPQPVERRKLLPDPDNEPDFYEISQLFPLPDDQTNQLEEARAALAKRGIYLANDAPAVPCPPYTTSSISTASVLSQIPSSDIDPSSLSPLHDLSASNLSAVAAARLSVVSRMQAMDSSANRLSSTNLPLYYGLSGIDQLPIAGLNSFTLRNSDLQLNSFNPLSQYNQNNAAYERLRSSLGLSQILADQQARDRIAIYLQYMNSQGTDDISSNDKPFNEQKH